MKKFFSPEHSARRMPILVLGLCMVFTLLFSAAPAWGDSAAITPTAPKGAGTKDDPYQIGSAAELYWFAGWVNGTLEEAEETPHPETYAQLTADIDLSGSTWTPIGNDSDYAYQAVFDGQDNTISGLTASGGLFGYVGSDGSVEDVTLSRAVVKGSGYASLGILANRNDGDIVGCTVEGELSTSTRGSTSGIGGIAGANTGVIFACEFSGQVTGCINNVGGIVGYNGKDKYTGTVLYCVNNGTISGWRNQSNGTYMGNYVGGIVGRNGQGDTTIMACMNYGNVIGGVYVGGIAGISDNTGDGTLPIKMIVGCMNYGTVTAEYPGNLIGGIVGCAKKGNTVSGCGNEGDVVGKGLNLPSGNPVQAGGVAGSLENATILACYNQGSIDGGTKTGAGGIAGQCVGNSGIRDCYNVGPVTGASGGTGAIAGTAEKINGIMENYYLKENGIAGVGNQTADAAIAKTKEAFASGEVTWLLAHGSQDGSTARDIWRQKLTGETAQTWPQFLLNEDTPVYRIEYTDTDGNSVVHFMNAPEGEGTEDAPYQISNADELYWFAGWTNGTLAGTEETPDPEAYAILTDDIDLTGRTWEPICIEGSTESTRYQGVFDGQAHTITGLTSQNKQGGLFGWIGENGTVKNLQLVDADVSGSQYASSGSVGTVANRNYGLIEACTVLDSKVTATGGSSSGAGGIAGANFGTVRDCSFGFSSGKDASAALVTGSSSIGGIVGVNGGLMGSWPDFTPAKAVVDHCKNTGTVTGPTLSDGIRHRGDYIGGIVGYNAEGGSQIIACGNYGPVTGSSYVGGIAGYSGPAWESDSGETTYNMINSCHNAGAVQADSGRGGGIVGAARKDNTIIYCGNEGPVSGNGDKLGGIAGSLETAYIAACYNQAQVDGETRMHVGGIAGFCTGDSVIGISYNVGDVIGTKGSTGAIAGTVDRAEYIYDNYYLDLEDIAGIGNAENDNIFPKTRAAFTSGEITWLLQDLVSNKYHNPERQIWRQKLSGADADVWPQLSTTAPTVYRVEYPALDGTTEVLFMNTGSISTEPGGLFPQKEGYEPSVYAVAEDGTLTEWDGQVSKDMKLQYKPISYTITYDVDGGKAGDNPETYTVETEDFTLKNPTKDGYTFTGWSGTGLTGEKNLEVVIKQGTTGELQFTAHFEKNSEPESTVPGGEGESKEPESTVPGGEGESKEPETTVPGDEGESKEPESTAPEGEGQNHESQTTAPEPGNGSTTNTPGTGDKSDLLIWGFVILLAGAGTVVCVRKRRVD